MTRTRNLSAYLILGGSASLHLCKESRFATTAEQAPKTVSKFLVQHSVEDRVYGAVGVAQHDGRHVEGSVYFVFGENLQQHAETIRQP